MWQKQQQVGSHMACAPFANLAEWNIWKRKSEARELLLNENYNHLWFKECLPNKGYSTLVRKLENHSSLSHWEELWLCTCTLQLKNWVLQKALISMWQILCQNYSRQELYQHSLSVAALASVQAGCVELIDGQFQRHRQKISWSRIHLQNLRGHPDRFSWLVTI